MTAFIEYIVLGVLYIIKFDILSKAYSQYE